MDAIKTAVKNGHIETAAPADWPEGCEVVIEPVAAAVQKIGLDESEWRDDPASLADWDAWIKTIEPLEFTPEEEAAVGRFNEEMGRYNVEAIRRQMGGNAVKRFLLDTGIAQDIMHRRKGVLERADVERNRGSL